MPVTVIDTIKPANGGAFPIADANDIIGGHHQVDTTISMNAINSEKLRIGMKCYVLENKADYRWDGNKWVLDTLPNATFTSNGLMSKEDKILFNSISTWQTEE